MSSTPPTGDMKRAMRDAVQRSKGNKLKAQDARHRWKEEAKRVRTLRARVALGVLVPVALLAVLYPLHTSGVLRLWKPSALSRSLSNPGQTTVLDLSAQYLTEVPSEIEQLGELRTLVLDSNRITQLSGGLGKLSKLENLSLAYNPLRPPFSGLAECRTLKMLNLSETGLTEIPPEVFALENLEVLVLKKNAISRVPDDLGRLRNLRVLDLKGNQIGALPASLNKLTRLTELELSGNPLKTGPDLAPLPKLKRVGLRSTGLRGSEIDSLRKNLRKEVTVNF